MIYFFNDNSVEQSNTWEASGRSASQEISRLLWNLKVYYSIHKRPPPGSIMSQMNPVHTLTYYLFIINFNTSNTTCPYKLNGYYMYYLL
jgi:hypothetical protein